MPVAWNMNVTNNVGSKPKWDAFDPNTSPLLPWATYIPDRNPSFKLHRTRGPALNAMGRNRRAILYEFDNARLAWMLVSKHDFQDRPEQCTNCGTSLLPPTNAPSWHRNLGRIVRLKPSLNYGWLCYNCRDLFR